MEPVLVGLICSMIIVVLPTRFSQSQGDGERRAYRVFVVARADYDGGEHAGPVPSY